MTRSVIEGRSADERRIPAGAWAIALSVVVTLLAVARRYGWHRDELYFLACARHLGWGYVDHPPFAPFVAWLADRVAPGDLLALRAVPAVTAGGSVVVGSLLARELGGSSRTQVRAAGVLAAGGFLLGSGHLVATPTFDLFVWLATSLALLRLWRTDDPRWWLAVGAVVGLGLEAKHLVVLVVVSALAGMVVERRWSLLVTPWTPAGALVALLLAGPHLWWQATNGWPQVAMAGALSRRLAVENRLTFLPLQVLLAGPLLIWLVRPAVRALRREPSLEWARPLLWAWPVASVICLATAGRPYYVLPVLLVVLIVGVVVRTGSSGRRLWPLVVANGALSVVAALPVLPLQTAVGTPLGALNDTWLETVGWPELTDQVAGVVRSLPAADRRQVVVLTRTYGEAAAIDAFGPARGLPPAYSPHNHYWFFRRPVVADPVVVSVRFDRDWLDRWFEDCRVVDHVDNGLGVANEVQGTPISICRGLRRPWPETWASMRFLS